MKKLVIMRGAPGSGKSTYVKQNYPNAVVCSADFYHTDENGNYNWRPENVAAAHASCQANCSHAMAESQEVVVVDNTNTRLKEMQPYLKLAETLGYEVVVVQLTMPLESLYGKNIHNVPNKSVKAMYERLEPYEGELIIKR